MRKKKTLPYNHRGSYYTEEQIERARSIDLLTYLQTYEPTELVHISSIITACSSAMMKTGSPDTVAIDRRMILLEYYDHPVVTNKSDYFHHPY